MADSLSPHCFAELILQAKSSRQIFLAYSGGVDSHVLLHVCAALPDIRKKLQAVHIHHGLQLQADSWAEHCLDTAKKWGVPCRVIRVNARPSRGQSPEEAARNARYDALRPLLQATDLLLLAQHRDDQLETVLLQLFRGSGLHGLSGMPEQAAFGQGRVLRPLLGYSRAQIEAYARQHALLWVEDPSNADHHYDRNFLRQAVIPQLKQRWPSLDKTVSRSAQHCAEAMSILNVFAHELYQSVAAEEDKALKVVNLRQLPYHQQKIVVRFWLECLQAKMPSQAVLDQIIDQIIVNRHSGNQAIGLPGGYQIRCYRDLMFCVQADEQPLWESCQWPNGQDFIQFTSRQTLECFRAPTGILDQIWQRAEKTLTFRTGGEKIKLPGRSGSHDLKKLYQEAGIPPWQRRLIPLIFLDRRLAAVGNLWIAEEFYTQAEGACLRFRTINL